MCLFDALGDLREALPFIFIKKSLQMTISKLKEIIVMITWVGGYVEEISLVGKFQGRSFVKIEIPETIRKTTIRCAAEMS